jgi:hypothetical protein
MDFAIDRYNAARLAVENRSIFDIAFIACLSVHHDYQARLNAWDDALSKATRVAREATP